MRLGTNFVHGVEEWSSFRPFRNPGQQIEPPWRGDWNNRVYDEVLAPHVEYKCGVSANGTAAGRYRIRLHAPTASGAAFRVDGDARRDGELISIGAGNVWIAMWVTAPTPINQLGFEMIPEGQSEPLATDSPWSDDLLTAIAPFHSCRVMNFCGVGSRVATAATEEKFGGFARRSPRWNDDSEFGRFDSGTGINPRFWFPPVPEAWINMPLFIALDPPERARWLAEAYRLSSDVSKVWVAVDNELGNNDFTMSRLAFRYARGFHLDQAVARTLGVLHVTAAIQSDIRALGIQAKFSPIFETLPGFRYPFEWDRWLNGGSWVSGQARDLLRQIGNVAGGFYVGRHVTETNQIDASLAEELSHVRAWVDLLGSISLTPNNLHAYECGWHWPPSSKDAMRRHPVVIEKTPQLLDAMAGVLGPASNFAWYGLCENDQWGSLTKLSDHATDPLYLALKAWAQAHPVV